MRLLVFLSLFAAVSVSQAGEWVRTGPTTISFHGTIEIDELQKFKEVYRPTDETIILHSGGGRMDAALDIGKVLIENKKLTAVVEGICASSCANYLFLAAKYKRIDDGIVGFHGNWKAMVSGDNYEKHLAALPPAERAKMAAFHREHVQAETKFLLKAGVSQSLFDRTQKENDAGVYEIYLPGPMAFEKYGIHNVVGTQDLNIVERVQVLYENSPDDNNAEVLKQKLRDEYPSAPDSRKDQIRAALQTLNQQFPTPRSTQRAETSRALN